MMLDGDRLSPITETQTERQRGSTLALAVSAASLTVMTLAGHVDPGERMFRYHGRQVDARRFISWRWRRGGSGNR